MFSLIMPNLGHWGLLSLMCLNQVLNSLPFSQGHKGIGWLKSMMANLTKVTWCCCIRIPLCLLTYMLILT